MNSAQTDVAAAPDGTVVGVWRRAGGEVQARVRAPGGALSQIRTLSPTSDGAPRVAVGGDGTAIAVWDDGGTIQYAIRPRGGNFGSVVDFGPGSNPVVAMNESGAAVAAWSDGANVQVRVRQPGGGGFGAAQSFPAAAADQLDAFINRTQVIALAWHVPGGARAAIRFSNGAWNTPTTLDGNGSEPQVAIDRTGIATAVWTAAVGVRWAPRAPGDPAFGPSQALGTGTGPADLAANPNARAAAVWIDGGVIQGALREGDGGFGAQTPISGPSASTPRVAVNTRGEAYAVWARLNMARTIIQGAKTGGSGGFGAVSNISNLLRDSMRPAIAADGAGNAAGIFHQTTDDVVQVAGFDGAPPALAGLSVPTSGVPGAVLPMSLSPFDVWSPVTTTWNFGDGQSATGNAVSHAYGAAGTFNLAVTARDAAGNAASTTRPVQIFSPPPPDSDGDGFNVTLDCDDANRTRFPGAPEVPGDRIDQDCNGSDAPFPLLLADVTFSFDRNAARTRFFLTQLAIKDALRGMRIEMRCTGKPKCKFRRKRAGTARRARVNILKKLNRKQRRFKLGQTLSVRMTMPGHMGKVTRIKFGKRRTRSVELCLPPGTKKPRRRCT